HLALARRQAVEERVPPAAAQELRDDRGIDRGATDGDATDRRREFLDVAHAVLEQVADALGRLLEEVHGEPELDVLRQDEHADRRVVRSDLLGGADALVVVRRRQTDVDDRDLRRVTAHLEQQLVRRIARADDVEVVVGEEPREPFAQEHAVLGDHYAHGISARTRVPPPRALHTRGCPSSASTRSASPRRPEPPSVWAPPRPSSTISTTSCSPEYATSTFTALACACFATLARLSDTR